MSDLLEVDKKVKEGADWRDYTTVEIDDEEMEVCYRNLYDDEDAEVVDTVGKEKFEEIIEDYQDEVDDEDRENVERYQELVTKREADDSELTEEEEDELETLEEEVDVTETVILDLLHPDFVSAMHKALEFMVCPDEEDVTRVLELSFNEQEEMLGETAKTREDAYDLLKEEIPSRITSNSTGYTAFALGLKLFFRSRGSEGN